MGIAAAEISRWAYQGGRGGILREKADQLGHLIEQKLLEAGIPASELMEGQLHVSVEETTCAECGARLSIAEATGLLFDDLE